MKPLIILLLVTVFASIATQAALYTSSELELLEGRDELMQQHQNEYCALQPVTCESIDFYKRLKQQDHKLICNSLETDATETYGLDFSPVENLLKYYEAITNADLTEHYYHDELERQYIHAKVVARNYLGQYVNSNDQLVKMPTRIKQLNTLTTEQQQQILDEAQDPVDHSKIVYSKALASRIIHSQLLINESTQPALMLISSDDQIIEMKLVHPQDVRRFPVAFQNESSELLFMGEDTFWMRGNGDADYYCVVEAEMVGYPDGSSQTN